MTNPSQGHLLEFGRVVHNFATVETGIKIALSGILQIDLAAALIVLEPCSAGNLKNIAKSLAKDRLKPKLAEQLCCIVGDWSATSGLRNDIAHSRWTDGDRPGSIKPRGLSIQEGRVKYIGDDEKEKSYTVSELQAEAEKLRAINERVLVFLDKSGLGKIVEAKMAEGNEVGG